MYINYSLPKPDDTDTYENFSEIFLLEGKLRKIFIVSAYHDLESIDQLIAYLEENGSKKPHCELVVLLDSRASMLEELKEKDKIVRDSFKSTRSGIYLVQAGSLFHSKGYLAESSRDGICHIGSLNFTQKGLTKNEELWVSIPYTPGSQSKEAKLAREFSGYVEYLLKCVKSPEPPFFVQRVSDKSDREPLKAGCLRDLFLDGVLYYQPTKSDPFGFKLKLPKEVLESRSTLSKLLPSKTSDTLNVLNLLGDLIPSESIKNSPDRSRWKKYCIQTCYGYWSPLLYQPLIDDVLDRKNKSTRKERFTRIKILLEKHADTLYLKIHSLCNSLVPEVWDQDERWRYMTKDGKLNTDSLSKDWKKWLTSLTRKLESEEFIKRLCTSVCYVKMPDIWEDLSAADEFTTSFFDSLAYELNRPIATQNNLIAKHWLKIFANNNDFIDCFSSNVDGVDDNYAYLKRRLDEYFATLKTVFFK